MPTRRPLPASTQPARFWRALALGLLGVLLAACGGDGGGPQSTDLGAPHSDVGRPGDDAGRGDLGPQDGGAPDSGWPLDLGPGDLGPRADCAPLDGGGEGPADAGSDAASDSGDLEPEDVGPPPPEGIDPAECLVVHEVDGLPIVELSGLELLPGVEDEGLPLLVAHGDNELVVHVLRADGLDLGEVAVAGPGDWEEVCLWEAWDDEGAARFDLVAVLSPGNWCSRGEGDCTEQTLLRFTLGLDEARRPVLLGEPRGWRVPEELRANTEGLLRYGDDLLLISKLTGDRIVLELPEESEDAALVELVEGGSELAPAFVTGLAWAPERGMLLATGLVPVGLDEMRYHLTSLSDRFPFPWVANPRLPGAWYERQVEALVVLPDGDLVVVDEGGHLVRWRCP